MHNVTVNINYIHIKNKYIYEHKILPQRSVVNTVKDLQDYYCDIILKNRYMHTNSSLSSRTACVVSKSMADNLKKTMYITT